MMQEPGVLWDTRHSWNAPKSMRVAAIVRQMEERHVFLQTHERVRGGCITEVLESVPAEVMVGFSQ